jgi:hypothetical protein
MIRLFWSHILRRRFPFSGVKILKVQVKFQEEFQAMSQRSVHDVGLLRSQSSTVALAAFLWLVQQKDHAWLFQTLPTGHTNPDRACHNWQVHIVHETSLPKQG